MKTMMFGGLAALSLVIAPMGAFGRAESSPPAARRATEYPITLAGTQILVDGVRINGQGPYRFLLDTGAQGQARVDATLVEALHLPQVGEVSAGAGGGGGPRRTLTLHRLDSLEFAGRRFQNLEAAARDYNDAGVMALRGHVDGVLGIDLLRGGLTTIDYGRGVLRLEPGALPEADGVAVLALDPEVPVPAVRLSLAGHEMSATLDTGSMGAVAVGDEAAAGLPFTAAPQAAGQAVTVGGAAQTREGRLDGDLKLGAFSEARPAIRILPHFQRANLGGVFLSRFVMTLDLDNHRVRLVPSASGGVAPRRYGFLLNPPRGGETELVLEGVAPGSPAEAGGLRAGDRLVALNGIAVADLGPRLGQALRSSPLTARYLRDGAPREATLTLE